MNLTPEELETYAKRYLHIRRKMYLMGSTIGLGYLTVDHPPGITRTQMLALADEALDLEIAKDPL